MSNKPELGYWGIRGLAQPIRLLLTYKSVDFEDRQYGKTENDWFGGAKPELQKQNPLINLPYYKDGEHVYTQSNAILTILGRRQNLYGNNEEEHAIVDQVLAQAADLRAAASRAFYGDWDTVKTEYIGEKGGMHTNLAKFEALLEHYKTDFIAGKEVTVADFPVYELLFVHTHLVKNVLEKYPKLNEYFQRFSNLPQIKSYEEGAGSQLSINSPYAKWGNPANNDPIA